MTEDKNQNFNVFAYGSLMDQRFVERLIGRAIKTMPAKLEGYKKLKLPNRKYPFAIKEPKSIILGKLLINLNLQELKKIEEWEKTPEPLYKEIKVSVETEEGKKEAFMYVGNEAKAHEFKIR